MGRTWGKGVEGGPRNQLLPDIMMRRGLERDTRPSVPGWQEAIYKGPPCTGHHDKAASGDLGAVSRNSRWEPAYGVRSVGRDRL